MYGLIAFVILSIPILIISRASLRHPGSHGFYRFFAWEFILVLIILNITSWFRDPWSWHQIISWLLLFTAFVPLIFGVRSLVTRGKPVAKREGDPALMAFEKTSRLVTSGVYHYIRHPLYSSLLFLTWGAFFKTPGLWGLLLAAAATIFLFLTARADEAECIRFFGEEYREYMKKTKRFVPFLW
ncbi:MAG: isoprenylcysteine carboxylmethyltransferase family protein [Anaerolineaceae bacterium]